MGKKSVMDTPLLPSAEGQGAGELEDNMPAERGSIGQLFQEFLQVAMQTQENTQESYLKNPVRTTYSFLSYEQLMKWFDSVF